LSNTSPSWAVLGLNSGLHGEVPATNCVSHGTASLGYLADDTCRVRHGAEWHFDPKAHTGTLGGWRWNFEMNSGSSVIIVTGLRAGRQKNQVSIAYRRKRFLSFAQGASRMWGLSHTGDSFAVGKGQSVRLTIKPGTHCPHVT